MKPWFKSRVIWLAIAQAIAGVLVVLQTQYPTVGVLVIFKSLADIILRYVSVTPIQ